MKKSYIRIITPAFVIAVLTICAITFRPDGAEVDKTAQPMPQAQQQSVRQVEPLSKPDHVKQLERTGITAKNIKEDVTMELAAPKNRQTHPQFVKHANYQPWPQTTENDTDDYEQSAIVDNSNIDWTDDSLLVVEMPQAPLTAQQQRHQERLKQVERDLRPTYSKEQLKRMRKQILVNLPKGYQDMFKNFEQMKQAEVEKRRLARSQPRQISGAAYYSDKGAKGEKPRFSNTEDYKDKDN